MSTIYIYHHLGLGDHIICNGLVRHYAHIYDQVYLFCKPHNKKNIDYMYRDRDNIKTIPIVEDDIMPFMKKNNQNNYLILGFKDLKNQLELNKNITFDNAIYNLAFIPFSYKWDWFYYQRDIEQEKYVYYNKLGLKYDDKFIFVHDNAENNAGIKKKYPKHLRIIRPKDKSILIFHYLYTIERASQVHCINSSFLNLIDCIGLRKEGLFFHKYARLKTYGDQITPRLKLDWKEIN